MKKSSGSTTTTRARADDVDAFLARLDHPLKAEIEAVRALIRGADPRIGEAVKWNAPSFHLGEHFATFKLHPATRIQIVLHTGAKVRPNAPAMTIADPTGLLKWAAADRCVVTLADLADIRARQEEFVAILKQWIAQLP